VLNWTTASGATSYDIYRNGSVYLTGVAGNTFENVGANVTAGTTYSYFVRARNANGFSDSGSLSATAPSNCGVTATTLTVVAPNGGQNWTAGSTHNVTWTISGDLTQISYQLVGYSTDGGGTYTIVSNDPLNAQQPPGARSFSWTLPNGVNTTQGRIQVTARAANTSIVAQDASDAIFTISTIAPTISSVNPNPVTADAGNGYQTLTVNGANFVNKPTLVLTSTGQPGYTLPASRVTYVSSSQLTMSIRLNAAADNWTVRAVNPDGQTSSAVGFQVLAPTATPPSVSSVSPNPVTGSASPQTITINGGNFVNKPTITLTWTGQRGYTVPSSQVTFVNSSQVQILIPTTTAPDNWTVRVTNPNGQSSGQLNFTVTGTPGQPNLVPQNVSLSSYSVQAGSQITVSWEIANAGSANCPVSVTGLRLGRSPTTRPSSATSLNGNIPTPGVNVGLPEPQNSTVTIPVNTAPGTYYIWVIADNVANSTLHQSITTDDYAHSAAITVGSGPSLLGEPASLGVIWFPSPNFNDRPPNQAKDTIVIHTTEGNYAGAKDILTNPDPRLDEPPVGVDKRVSAHYVISETGEILQLVELDKRAWHATYYNDRSIGIEMVGFAGQEATWNAQNLAALKNLVRYLVVKYDISIVHPPGDASTYPNCRFTESGLVAHSQIQPGCNGFSLKTDPGGHFDWPTFVSDVQTLVDAPRFTIVGRAVSQGTGGQFKSADSAVAKVLTDGQFKIHISTPSQQPVTVQASDDLLNWVDVGTANMLDGKSVFTDTDAGAHAKRFYRPKP
jgi:N-acetyl-anhydromuramyl-L-alanine amidase AmpD